MGAARTLERVFEVLGIAERSLSRALRVLGLAWAAAVAVPTLVLALLLWALDAAGWAWVLLGGFAALLFAPYVALRFWVWRWTAAARGGIGTARDLLRFVERARGSG